MTAYWTQFSTEEIHDMIGVEELEHEECEIEEDIEKIDHSDCPKCMGYGCRYCLMTEW